MIRTAFTEAFGLDTPIVQGGMQGVGRAELVGAVANAGALGLLTALTQPTPEDLRSEIRRTRTFTDRPFGVNLTVLPTIDPVPYGDYLRVAIEERVPYLETAGSDPTPYVKVAKPAGMKVIHKCTSVRHALRAQSIGVDAVSIDGFECAGHPGEDDVPGLVLIPRAADLLQIPLLASGGIADGRGLAAALSLGADGVTMGSRFLASQESPVHDDVKKAIVNGDELGTTLLFRTLRNTTRVATNEVATEAVKILERGGTFDEVRHLVAGSRGRLVFETGDIDAGIWTIGQSQGLINDIPSCAEIVARTVADAEDIITNLMTKVGALT